MMKTNQKDIQPIVERVWRIGQTGETANPKPLSPVDNLMQYYNKAQHLEQPQEAANENVGLWQGFKNFAGTNGGRMLLGGLGTAAGVALTGGNFKDALGYGIVGAGNTAQNLYKKEQNAKAWAEKESDRLARKEELKEGHDLQYKIHAENIAAQAQARKDQYNNMERLLGIRNNFSILEPILQKRAMDNFIANGDFSDEQKDFLRNNQYGFNNDSYFQNILLNPSSSEESRNSALNYFGRKQALDKILNLPEPVPFKDFAQGMNYLKQSGADDKTLQNVASSYGYDFMSAANAKDYAPGDLGLLQFYMDQGKSLDDARLIVGNMTPEEKKRLEIDIYANKAAIDAGKDTYVHSTNAGTDFVYNERGKDNQLDRDMTLKRFESALPTIARREAEEAAQAMGVPVSEIYVQMRAKRQSEIREAAARVLKLMKETDNLGKPGFNELQTGVNNGTISADVANQQYGQDVFQAPVAKDNNDISNIRKEFNSLTSDYRSVGDAFARIKASYENPSPAGDLSMVFNYMKALDPGSVVRESEFANAENARAWFDEKGVPTGVKLAYEKAVNGGRLTDEQRKDFYNMAVNLFRAQQNQYRQAYNFYLGIVERNGWDPRDVLLDPYTGILNNTSGQTTAAQAAPDLSNISTEELLARLQNG